ncbi:MAG TPA: hypothetical protein VFZ66_30015 [Herpetosiphonaceae bacterium]
MTILPPDGALLTAAEALVLQNPDRSQGRAALKLTLIELLARKLVTLRSEEKKGMLGRVHKTDYLHLSQEAHERAPQGTHVRSVLEVLAAAGANGSGATMAQVVRHAQKAFGSDLAKFQSAQIIPTLISRGLIESYTAKRLGIFSTTRYRPTAVGASIQQQLAGSMAQARTLPTLIDHDPASAAALVAGLGSMVLLVDELKPHYARISQALRPAAADGADFELADPGNFDASLGDSFDFDLSAFDALDSSLDAFDSSFDAADSGSDGGDGGGSSD